MKPIQFERLERLTVFNPASGEYDWSPEAENAIRLWNDPTSIGRKVREYVGKCEDVNIKPEEIAALVADNERLRVENERLKKDVGEHPCIVCRHKAGFNEPSPARCFMQEDCFEWRGLEDSTCG